MASLNLGVIGLGRMGRIFARHIATRVVFCANGKVVEQGRPEQIFSQPRETRTREFLEKVVHLD